MIQHIMLLSRQMDQLLYKKYIFLAFLSIMHNVHGAESLHVFYWLKEALCMARDRKRWQRKLVALLSLWLIVSDVCLELIWNDCSAHLNSPAKQDPPFENQKGLLRNPTILVDHQIIHQHGCVSLKSPF